MTTFTVDLRVVYEAEDSDEAEDLLSDMREGLRQQFFALVLVDNARLATTVESEQYAE